MSSVFVTGGTGYLGSALLPKLVKRGHRIRALVRAGSEKKLPAGCEIIVGNALDKTTFEAAVQSSETFIQLLGVSHPGPAKAAQFQSVDFVSASASIEVAATSNIKHFIYVSVAHPAPIMQEYIRIRVACEELLRKSGLHATIIRPWYVLGKGHRWPYLFLPVYWIFKIFPSTRESVRRLDLVTLPQMIRTMMYAVEHPSSGIEIIDVPRIRALSSKFQI